jgi:hypothetical protein
MSEEEKKSSSPKEKLLATARDRYKRGVEHDDANRKAALEAIRFRNGSQWDDKIKNAREQDPEGARPCLVVDKTGQYLRQVVNDEKQNRPSIKVRPVDDKGDPEVAKILQGIIRHIEDISGADLAYDTAYEQSVDGGYGYFRLLTEYCDAKSFDQDILIKRIRNRFQVVLDDARQEPDGSDSQWGFIIEKMPREEYEKQHPDNDPCNFEGASDVYSDWIEEKYVLVAEYFHFETKEATLCLYRLPDGSLEPIIKGEPLPPGVQERDKVKERKTRLKKLKWDKISAKDVLESRELPGDLIPIIEVIGEEIDEEGKSHKNGLLKRAMEPQRMHNYAASSFVENVALAPKAPWVAAAGQVEGYEHDWRTANRRNLALLTYKPVVMEGDVPVPPPQRAQPPGIPIGWQQALQNTEHDISSSMGMYAETVLGTGDANSGKQEALQQKRGDTATFHFMDNLARSVRYAGKIALAWLPTYYDTARVARIMGEDGTPQMVRLDPNQPEAVKEVDFNGKMEKVYNINVGKYDVTVQTGPGFMTKRQEAVEFLSQIATAAKDPATSQVITYLAVKNNDWEGADEATAMLKKLLPPGVAPAEDGEEEVPMVPTPQGPIPLPQASEMIAGLMQQVEQMGEGLKKAGDLDQIERQVKDEAVKVDAGVASLDAKRAEIAAAERESSLRAQAEQLKLQAERDDIEAAKREFALQQQLAQASMRADQLEGQVVAGQPQGEGEDGAAPARQVVVVGSQAAGPFEMLAQALMQQSERLERVAIAAAAPRQTDLVMGPDGMPVASVSRTIQ